MREALGMGKVRGVQRRLADDAYLLDATEEDVGRREQGKVGVVVDGACAPPLNAISLIWNDARNFNRAFERWLSWFRPLGLSMDLQMTSRAS